MEYRTTLGMLSVLAVGGKEIKGRSMFSVNPYITFQIDHMKKKTKVSKGKGKNPKWNDLIEFEIIKGRDVLNGKVMGKEISEDEFIGDIKVDLKPIFQKGYAEMWVPVIHPHKNRHKGDVFLKLQYKPTPREQNYPAPMGAPMGDPMGGPRPPQGSPMGGPARPPPLQRSATAPIPIRPAPGVQIPPRQGGPIPSPINVPPRGASPNVRPFPSPVPQRQGIVLPRSQTYNPPPPQRSPSGQIPPRQMSHPQIQTGPGGVSPRIPPSRSPRPVSPNVNGISQRMPRPPMGPRPPQ
ncbi:hypothetical protein H8356DRAFT_1053452 [Neocallimastix lanati (nom. inval.)]|nr:hypothetical protein H8356DRAFT_1053452 [Neocallimastix sp. JGI-2020a]